MSPSTLTVPNPVHALSSPRHIAILRRVSSRWSSSWSPPAFAAACTRTSCRSRRHAAGSLGYRRDARARSASIFIPSGVGNIAALQSQLWVVRAAVALPVLTPRVGNVAGNLPAAVDGQPCGLIAEAEPLAVDCLTHGLQPATDRNVSECSARTRLWHAAPPTGERRPLRRPATALPVRLPTSRMPTLRPSQARRRRPQARRPPHAVGLVGPQASNTLAAAPCRSGRDLRPAAWRWKSSHLTRTPTRRDFVGSTRARHQR